MRRTFALILLAAVSAAPSPAGAQDGLTIDRDRLDRRPGQALPGATAPTPGAPTQAEAIAPFVLRAVSVQGSRLGQARVEAAVQPFIGQTLDGAGLARLRAAVLAAYQDTPFALPVAALDMRRAAEGVIVVTAVEGRVARVNIGGETEGDIDLLRHYAARLTTEAPLSRPTAERYFSLIADIPGAKTTVTTAPSATPGALDLGLGLDQTRWEFVTGMNNRGSRALGRTQWTASATLNRAFRLGDQTRLALTVPNDIDRFQYLALSHRQPIGYDGAAASLSLGHLRTRLPSGVEGDATTAGLVFSWPLIRSYRSNLYLSGGIDGLDSDNAVFGDLVSTEKTRTARASAAWSRVGARSSVGASGTVSQGIDGLGAQPNLFADAGFTKVNVRVEGARAVGRTVRLSGAATVQWSDDPVPNSELFSLGGGEFGKAFSSALLVGDSGYGGKAEAAWRPAMLPRPVRGSEVYVFGDQGEVRVNGRAGLPGRSASLASAGLGVRLAVADRAVIEVEAAKAVDKPDPAGDDWRWGFGVTARF